MRYSRQFLLSMLCLLFALPTFAQVDTDEDVSKVLDIREEDQLVVYGEYVEVEINSNEDVELTLASEVKPYGLELEMIDSKTAILFGQVEFQEKICFIVDARKRNGNVTAERLCLYAEENEEISYPKITTSRYLDEVKANQYSSVSINVDAEEALVDTTVLGSLPVGLSVTSTSSDEVVLTGTISEAGVYEFVVKAKEVNSDVVTYKQLQINVIEQDIAYQCAPGYYWDDYLNYCVQADGRSCGEGTFWDVSSQTCRSYRTHNSCRIGTYYDHYLNRCVRIGGMRCPLNYEWDGYYSRCVRLPYTCSFAQKYDYRLRRCVSIFRTRTCSIGYHWNSFRLSCVRNVSYCRAGSYWSGRDCIRTVRTCSSGRYFDPHRRRCVSRSINRSCNLGYNWDYGRRSCVRRAVVVNRSCVGGTRWSSRSRQT